MENLVELTRQAADSATCFVEACIHDKSSAIVRVYVNAFSGPCWPPWRSQWLRVTRAQTLVCQPASRRKRYDSLNRSNLLGVPIRSRIRF